MRHFIYPSLSLVLLLWAAQTRLTAQPPSQNLALPGPFAAGWRSLTILRDNGGTLPVRIYYPATTNGQNAPLARNGTVTYPALTFGHGFLQPVTRYESTLNHLATHGYIIIASESEGGLFPSHQNFANDMRFCLTFLEQQNISPVSFLQGAVNTARFGAFGHSMGGGASILATAADSRIKALANLAAAETNPSATGAMAQVRVPTVLLSGSADTIVPVASNGQTMYANGTAPRLLPVIQGGWHCGFEDVSTFGCDSGPLARETQLALTRRWLTGFFHLYLQERQNVWPAVWGSVMQDDPAITTQAQSGVQLSLAAGSNSPASSARNINSDLALDTRGQRPQVALTYRLTVTQRGPQPCSYALSAAPMLWAIDITPAQTGVLNANQAQTVTITVNPSAEDTPAHGAATISARSLCDGGTRQFGTLKF